MILKCFLKILDLQQTTANNKQTFCHLQHIILKFVGLLVVLKTIVKCFLNHITATFIPLFF